MFRNKYILIRNLATLFIVCNMLYRLFPFPPIAWRMGIVLLSLFSVINNNHKTFTEQTLLFFAFFNLLHFIISLLWINPSTTYIGNTLCIVLSFSLFSYLGQFGVMDERYFSITSILILIGAIVSYYQSRAMIIESLMLDDDANITNSYTGYFLYIIPMLFLTNKKWQKWIVLVMCLFFIISGAKRGNLFAAIIPTLLFIWYELKDSKHSSFKTLFVIIAIVVVSILLYKWVVTNDYLINRLESTLEGNSSNRNNIYLHAWQTWYNSDNIINLVFGYGYDGTINSPLMRHMHAHNDWLEILVDYGILGVILYFTIFISLFKQIRITKNITGFCIMVSSVFIWLFKSFYSMGFVDGGMAVLMISMGSVVGIQNSSSVQETSSEL